MNIKLKRGFITTTTKRGRVEVTTPYDKETPATTTILRWKVSQIKSII